MRTRSKTRIRRERERTEEVNLGMSKESRVEFTGKETLWKDTVRIER